ncbi:MAG: molybdopterin molybdotransferase MoeA [Methylobacteriaceae bacterium]|nr:molybdopterin molybdotransferase MoeA [Methylobacteriaceae bacterium]
MAQLSDDAFAFGSELMPVEEARRAMAERVAAVAGTEMVPLIEADGRVLAEPLIAPIDLPNFDNSAVDGYAVRFASLAASGETILPVSGRVAAGHAGAGSPPDSAVRIFTGAPMPENFDTVFMQEDCRELDGGRVVLPPGLEQGANRRPRGEDIVRGKTALAAGRRLGPREIALAAALGVDRVCVRRRLKIAVFSTGDEIVSPGEKLPPAGLYDSNRFALQVLLRRLCCDLTDLGILRDKRGDVSKAISSAARDHDAIITSGGVSTGEEDHVRAAMLDAGSLAFWRLAIKPGRPVAMGVVEGAPLIGLPGNPVAVFVTFVYVVRPLLAALSGETLEPPHALAVTADFDYRKKKGRREYVRVSLTQDASAGTLAHKYPVDGAGVLTSLTSTDGLVELPEDITQVRRGDRVNFIDYRLLQ